MSNSDFHSSADIASAAEKIIESHIRMIDIGCGDEFRIPDAIATVRKERSLSHANDLIGCIASWAAADIAKLIPAPAQASSGRSAILEEAARVAENGCLAPPDGGSPTEEERELCQEIASRIRLLKLKGAEVVFDAQPPAAPVETATKSAPGGFSSQNTAESDPSVTLDYPGADTQCSADNGGEK